MKKESEIRPTRNQFDTFFKVFAGNIFFQSLSTAIQFDLFSLLKEKGPMTKEEIANKLGIEVQPCRTFLLGLVSNEILVKVGDKYENGVIANYHLTTTSPEKMIDLVKFYHFIVYKPMFHFYDAVKKNKNVGLKELPGEDNNLYQRIESDPFLLKVFQDAMGELSELANKDLIEKLDLKNVNFLIDVGGGNGTNIIRLAQKNPHLKAAVFDLPEVCKLATEHFKESRLENRLSAISGHCFEDEFPSQVADCFIFCHFFTIWKKEKNLELLKKAYRSLKNGGRVAIFNMMQNDSEDGPMSAAMGSPYFQTLATGEGMLYTWNEHIELFKAAGFTKIQTQQLYLDHGIIVGIKE